MKIISKVPIRIAFGCQKRVGKDTACQHLQTLYGGKILHFSDDIYKIMKHAYETIGIDYEKDREFLRFVGQWARDKQEDVWIKSLMNKINDDENIFVGDVRLPNEFNTLRKNGFTMVRIIRQDNNVVDDHITETALVDAEWDHVIYNDKLTNFLNQIEIIV